MKKAINNEYKRVRPKAWGEGVKEDKKRNVYTLYKGTGIIDYEPAIRELSKISHLPKFICRRVYDAETELLDRAGILYIKNK